MVRVLRANAKVRLRICRREAEAFVSFIASDESLRSLLRSPNLWFYGSQITPLSRCLDLRPNKDAAWKLSEIGDVQDCEKTLAVRVHETGLIENRGEVTRKRSSPS